MSNSLKFVVIRFNLCLKEKKYRRQAVFSFIYGYLE